MRFHVFVDFDGTIAPLDTTDLLLERFADPRWLDIEEQWKAGLIGSRECMVRQVDLIRATPEQIDRFVDEVEIDPGFRGFVRLMDGLGHAVTVVSDGLDRTVGPVLKRAGIDVPLRANRLAWAGGDRWRLTFPHARSDCLSLAGNCKCQFADADRVSARIVVGDGRSDFCIAGRADLVLAKGPLVRHCSGLGLPHVVFRDFGEASELLMHWIAARAEGPAECPAQLGDD